MLLAASSGLLPAQSGYIYSKPEAAAAGGIEGSAPAALTHAIAIDHTRVRVYLAGLSGDGRTFRFEHLPVGKYDLVLVTADHAVLEGLSLGEPPGALTPVSRSNLETRVALADSFFNRYIIHRIGIADGKALLFVERVRDKQTLKQSGEKLDANLRRLEIIELAQADDDWQMAETRHLYRESEPIQDAVPFFKHQFVAGLGNIRVVDGMKELGRVGDAASPGLP